LEDGFPCSHRPPRQYLLGYNAPWYKVYSEYETRMKAEGHRVLSLSRWRQYVIRLFPGVKKRKTSEDLCDGCVRLDVQLARTDLTEKERESLELEKQLHLEATRSQRQAMNAAIRSFALKGTGSDSRFIAG
jgi:hypothetical protein